MCLFGQCWKCFKCVFGLGSCLQRAHAEKDRYKMKRENLVHSSKNAEEEHAEQLQESEQEMNAIDAQIEEEEKAMQVPTVCS